MIRSLFVIFFVLIFFAGSGFCQDINATTEDGRAVILKKDGTWQFSKKQVVAATGEGGTYRKPKDSSAVYTTKNGKISIWFDQSKWTQRKTDNPAKTMFEHKDGDINVMVIAERIEMERDAFRQMAINNAQAAAPDIRVTYEGTRAVNGKAVLCMKMEGTIQSVHFVYYGYYYSGKEGTVQLIAFTSSNLFNDYLGDMSDFLNGLVINE